MKPALTILTGSASTGLGAEICELLGAAPVTYESRRFPDTELQVELGQSVRGRDVFLIQSTSPPVDLHLVELLMLADACRRAGANRLIGILPYLGYARQDRRAGRRSLGARVAADVIGTAAFDRLVLIDAHTAAIEGFFATPIEHLTAAPLLAQSVAPLRRDTSVVVAPDLGAVKLAREYARLLRLPMAVVHKTRQDGESVEAHAVMGDVRGRAPLVVDDMLSTGATIEAALAALRAAGAVDPMTVVVTHALLVGRARQLLPTLGLDGLFATNSIAVDEPVGVRLELVSLAPLLADAIRYVHQGDSLAALRHPG